MYTPARHPAAEILAAGPQWVDDESHYDRDLDLTRELPPVNAPAAIRGWTRLGAAVRRADDTREYYRIIPPEPHLCEGFIGGDYITDERGLPARFPTEEIFGWRLALQIPESDDD